MKSKGVAALCKKCQRDDLPFWGETPLFEKRVAFILWKGIFPNQVTKIVVDIVYRELRWRSCTFFELSIAGFAIYQSVL